MYMCVVCDPPQVRCAVEAKLGVCAEEYKVEIADEIKSFLVQERMVL